MQLNISHNTMIATEFASRLMVEAVKRSYPKTLIVNVDLQDDFDWNSIHQNDPEVFFQFLVHYTIKEEKPWFSVEAMPDEVFQSYFIEHAMNWTFNFLIFYVENWEPYYWRHPDGIVEKIAMLSYFIDYGYTMVTSRQYSRVFFFTMFSLDDQELLARRWHNNTFLILSKK